MKFVSLLSGGKDSIYNTMRCIQEGHELVACAHLSPKDSSDEADSYMYQSVGSNIVVDFYGDCMDVPLFCDAIEGDTVTSAMEYTAVDADEVEDLYKLLLRVKEAMPDVQGVAAGALFSQYQLNRVQNVCDRLGLEPLSLLWQRDQVELLDEMIREDVGAILIKVAVLGLNKTDLGKSLGEMRSKLHDLKDKYGINVCGEGGEYETLTLDCPLFKKKKIVIDEVAIITHSEDAFAPVEILKITKAHLSPK